MTNEDESYSRNEKHSLLHVTEQWSSFYLQTYLPETLLDVAGGVQHHLWLPKNVRGSFRDHFHGTEITPEMFDDGMADYMQNKSGIEGIYDINFDEGQVSALNPGNEWDSYAIRDLRDAVEAVALIQDEQDRRKQFEELLQGKALRKADAPIFANACRLRDNDRQIALFHVKERDEEAWLSVDGPLRPAYTAASLRAYLSRPSEASPSRFAGYFTEARQLTQQDYDWYVGKCLRSRGKDTEVYDLDLDAGVFSVLNTGQTWNSYSVEGVCAAAYKAGRRSYSSIEELTRRFHDGLAGYGIQRNDLSLCICGNRRLHPDEIQFSGVEQNGKALIFTMKNNFPVDEVFGTDISRWGRMDNYVIPTLRYDLKRGEFDSRLDLTWVRGFDREMQYSYRLNAEERDMVLQRADIFCQEQMGMPLGEYRAEMLNLPADPFRTIEVTMHEYKLEALEEQMDALGTDVEAWMQDRLIELYSELVPYEQQEIRQRIDAEDTAPSHEQEPSEAQWEQRM